MSVWISQRDWDEVRSILFGGIKVFGGFIQRYGSGKSAGINIIIPRGRGGGGSSGSIIYPAKLKSGTTLGGYVADFYANGFDQTATKSSQTCQVLDLAASDNVPVGEQFMAIPMKATVTGDTE